MTTLIRTSLAASLLFCWITALAHGAAWEAPPAMQTAGQFWRLHWYKRGIEHGNPAYDARFRVNSPEVSVHPVYGKRAEARENGMMLIDAPEDLLQLAGAELYLEMWGGHPGGANKRVTINGRSTCPLPRVGTEDGHCTYSYPSILLKIADLVNGHNAFQFALDQGTTFWGHMIVDNACLRAALMESHPDLKVARLDAFKAQVQATRQGGDAYTLTLIVDPAAASRIAAVDFQAYYLGYDENGNGQPKDWHGFTKSRQPVAMLGTTTQPPFEIQWNTAMLPSQKDVAVRAFVHFKETPDLIYVTPATAGLDIPQRPGHQVVLFSSHDLPLPFWSRDKQAKQCTIYLDVNPKQIERAELHVNAWTGGSGTIQEYFKLNGKHFPVADGSKHELVYNRMTIDPSTLKQGLNTIELLSDTEHHGIEILLPGPCLILRYKTGPAQ